LAEVARLLGQNKLVIKVQKLPLDRAAEAYASAKPTTSAESSS
jgi:hypothetical protein